MKPSKISPVTHAKLTRVSPLSLLPYFLQPNGCWECALKDKAPGGYRFVTRKGRRWRAHRYQWVKTIGPLLPEENVLHRCDYPPCINPAHLFVGSLTDNHKDMVRKKRNATRERNGSAKLTEKDVLAIRASREPGPILAARYGCSVMNISKIKRGITWAAKPGD